jgi:hypothetical protein
VFVTKSKILVLGATFFILFLNCQHVPKTKSGDVSLERSSVENVKIQVDRDTYLPVLSSTVGIGLTPIHEVEEALEDMKFHWRTNYGYFVDWHSPEYRVNILGAEVIHSGEKIYWSYDPQEMGKEKPPVLIRLRVVNEKSDDVFYESSLQIFWEDIDTATVMK